MKLAIMQPYLFPYIGYFQLMNAVDEFVVYDNIQYSKKGWINRNRILVNGTDAYITFPLKKDSDYLNVKDRYLSDNWAQERKKTLNRITESYRKAPYFKEVYPLLEKIVLFEENNLFKFTYNSLILLKEYLGIKTEFSISSDISIDHSLKSEKKVIEICKAKKADTYINPIGGLELYKKEEFKKEGIDIHFLKTTNVNYKQFDNNFVPMLSIIDVMMFNAMENITKMIQNNFTLI